MKQMTLARECPVLSVSRRYMRAGHFQLAKRSPRVTVLAAACGSFPEVGGELVYYLDPWNARAWADAIWDWSADDEMLAKVADNIRSNYSPRTWAATADSVKQLIDEILTVHDDNLQSAVIDNAG
jgi:hypothetical protein